MCRRKLRCEILNMTHACIFVYGQSYYDYVVLRKCSPCAVLRVIYDYVNHILSHKISKSIITEDLCYLMRDS